MVRLAGTQDGRELQFWELFTKLGHVVDLQGAGFRVKKCQIFFLHSLPMGACFICNLLLQFAFTGKSETLFLNKISKPWLISK